MNAKDLLCGNPLHPDFKEEKWYGVVKSYKPNQYAMGSDGYCDEIKFGAISGVRYGDGVAPDVDFGGVWVRASYVCDDPKEAIEAFVTAKSEELRNSFAGQIIKIEKDQKPKKPKKKRFFSK